VALEIIARRSPRAGEANHEQDTVALHSPPDILNHVRLQRAVIVLNEAQVRYAELGGGIDVVESKPQLSPVIYEQLGRLVRTQDAQRDCATSLRNREGTSPSFQFGAEDRLKVVAGNTVEQLEVLVGRDVSHASGGSGREHMILAFGRVWIRSHGSELDNSSESEWPSMLLEEVPRDGVSRRRCRTHVPVCRNIDTGDADSWRTHPRQVIDDDLH
jgi:hypothetical protein